MRHLLTTFAAAAFVVGLGFAIAPAHAAPLPQLNGPSNQASPVEKVGYYGYRRYGYYPRHRYYWRPRYYRPYYGYGYYRPYRYGYWNLIIGAGSSPFDQDQDRSASRRS
jgi:hypothetical protein